MENFINNLLELIDKYYHQKNINKKLVKLNLKKVIDVELIKVSF